MAGYLTNSLYAPLINTFMRAFPNNTDAVIFFSISPLNDISLIKKVHVSLVDQRTNENALNDITGVLIYEFDSAGGDASTSVGLDTTSGMYYIVIPRFALKNGPDWNINQFYKVQIRLDCTEYGAYADEKEKTTYLQDNQTNFSEWSTVCLLRAILQPNIQLRQFDLNDSSFEPSYNPGIIPINGHVFFGDGNNAETETLQSFKIDIIPRDTEAQVVYTTGMIYTGNQLDPNDINYRLDLQGLGSSTTSKFLLQITITTKNQYVMSKDYEFNLYEYTEMTDFHPVGVNEDSSDTSLTVVVNDEEGTATFRFLNQAALYGTLYVKRSSSVSNFKKWESILEKNVSDIVDITITDNTVGSHIWYRYSIQFENVAGAMSQVYYTNIIFPQFYDAFLTRLDRQLDLRYDFKISSIRPVVNRAKIDTLGGKYPKFAENAVLNYKQFSVTGLISAEADYHQYFMTKSGYFKDSYNHYRTFLSQEKILDLIRNDSKDWLNKAGEYLTTTYQDWFWEREFREEAIKWLNDGEPKLFRSMTEGAIPVMITDISLTPKGNLGRRLYDFSCTMYEVGDYDSLEDLEALGIIDIPRVEAGLAGGGDFSYQPPQDYRDVVLASQIYEFVPSSNNNLITSGEIYAQLMDKYNSGGIYSVRDAYDIYIKDLKVFFHSKPHMYVMLENNNLQLITDPTTAQLETNNIRLGYTLQIQTSDSAGWQTIFVNERGYYQTPRDVDITGVAFPVYGDEEAGREGDLVSIEYLLCYKERAAEGTVIKSQMVDRTLIGQYEGVFKPNQYLGEFIRAKYNYIDGYTTQKMNYWRGIYLDVTPYAVAHIYYRDAGRYNDYVIGESGILHMLRESPVQDMCFLGVRMVEQPAERARFLDEHEYCIMETSADSEEEIKHPVNNGVYFFGGIYRIYKDNKWSNFTVNGDGTGIAAINVEGSINYLGDVVKTEY